MTASTNAHPDDADHKTQGSHSGSHTETALIPPLPTRHELHAYAPPQGHHISGQSAMPRLIRSFGKWLLTDPGATEDAPPEGFGATHLAVLDPVPAPPGESGSAIDVGILVDAETHGGHTKHHETHAWWKVMCLTGVDYFSTLGYQPGIAFLAAGALSPVATAILVLVTLFGALPMYNKVALESPHGEGSIQMLRGLLPRWQGKTFVLALLGFAATSWIITVTLSAADATAHIIENPFFPPSLHHYKVEITLALIAALGAVFLKGFREAIDVAVGLVVVYLLLNAVVIAIGLAEIVSNPDILFEWRDNLNGKFSNPVMMIVAAALLFPNLALGLSGFETGVAVMPQVKGAPGDDSEVPMGRIRNARKLLAASALIMSVYLIGSSLITTTLIPEEAFAPGGKANGRALAYLAYEFLGPIFGTIYDISTIAILWFAGASALAGLLNLVPNYLPKYGMSPEFIRTTRPLTIVLTLISFAVTIWFKADVDAQGGAYATGVLALIASGAFAVTLAYGREGRTILIWVFGAITAIFFYTLAMNILERPDGLEIASFFIVTIIITSIISRVFRSTELRADRIIADDEALAIIDHSRTHGTIRLVCNRPEHEAVALLDRKEAEERAVHNIPAQDPIIFLEVYVPDSSEFSAELIVTGHRVGHHNVLRVRATTIPNAIAAILLWIRDIGGVIPHTYMEWTEGSPLAHAVRFLLFGRGETGPMTREVLRAHEDDRTLRPFVHVG